MGGLGRDVFLSKRETIARRLSNMESKISEGKDDKDDEYYIEELMKFTNSSNYIEKVII